MTNGTLCYTTDSVDSWSKLYEENVGPYASLGIIRRDQPIVFLGETIVDVRQRVFAFCLTEKGTVWIQTKYMHEA